MPTVYQKEVESIEDKVGRNCQRTNMSSDAACWRILQTERHTMKSKHQHITIGKINIMIGK